MSHPVAQLWKAGYRDLVSVVPPDAQISPRSRLSPHSRGKAPGVLNGDGLWSGYNFLKADPPTAEEVVKWVKGGANVGLLGERFPGIDIDVEHPQLSKLIVQEAHRFLGPAPVRTSREPRKLLVYRIGGEPFGRLKATITFAGKEHVVEVLCAGRQYLIYGRHPSGTDYGWEQPLWETAPDDLVTITSEDVLAFFAHLRVTLGGRADVEIQGDSGTGSGDAPPQELLRAPSPAALEALVAGIPNTYDDRESYITFGHAVKAAGGDEAFPIFLEWALRWEGGTNDPETVRADWDRMHAPFRVGWTWLTQQGTGAEAVDEFEADPEQEGKEIPPPALPGTLDFTDTWVVSQLVPMLVDRIRYVPESGHWHVWDKHVWAMDRRNVADHLIRKALLRLSSYILDRAAALSDDEQKAARKAAYGLQQRAALTKAVPELQAHPALTLCVEDFDSDDWVLNTPGGIVDLRTGEVGPSDPAALCSKATVVGPRKGTPTRWLEFLDEACDGDADMAQYLQRLTGYALTGSTQEQILAFVHGPPMTGKTVFLETVGRIFGTYHETTNADTFAKGPTGRHPADLAALAGARLVTASETVEGRGWDSSRVKSLTGGDEVAARYMRQDFFTYKPRYQIIIVGNHEPEVDGADDAILRRLHVVPFESTPENPDRLLFEKLKEEYPQILNWMIEGTRLWLEEGLTPPEVVQERTDEYKKEEDPVGLFLDECCVLDDPNASVSRRALYRVWLRWCRERGEEPGTLKQLRRRFRGKQRKYRWVDSRVSDNGEHRQGYRGLGLREDDPILDGDYEDE